MSAVIFMAPAAVFTSHLVTPSPPRRRCHQPHQRLGYISSLVTLKQQIPSAHQRFAPFSSLVTLAPFSPILEHIRGAHPAMPAPDSRDAGRRSSRGSPACAANGFDWLACSPLGIWVVSNTSAECGCADRGETTLGSTGIDAVLFFSLGLRSSWTHIMPKRLARPIHHVMVMKSSPAPRSRCRHVNVNAIPRRPQKCSRSAWNADHVPAGIRVHVAPETSFMMSRHMH